VKGVLGVLLSLLIGVAGWGAPPNENESILPSDLVQAALRWEVMGPGEEVPCEALVLILDGPADRARVEALIEAGYAVSAVSGNYVSVLGPITLYIDEKSGPDALGFVRSTRPYLENWHNTEWEGWTDDQYAMCTGTSSEDAKDAAAEDTWDDVAELLVHATFSYEAMYYEDAIKLYEEALAIARALDEQHAECEVLYNLGRCYLQAELPWHALEAFHEAMGTCLDSDIHEGHILLAMSQAYAELERYAEGIQYSVCAAELFEEDELEIQWALANVQCGKLLLACGCPEDALDHFYDALRMFRVVGGRLRCCETWLEIGKCLAVLGEYQLSLEALENALGIAMEIAWREGEASVHFEMGKVYEALSLYSSALESYTQSQTIYEQCGNHTRAAESRLRLAGLQSSLGEYSRILESVAAAASSLQAALENISHLNPAPGQAYSRPATRVDILLLLASCHAMLGDETSQQQAQMEAVAIANSLQWPIGSRYEAAYQQAATFACKHGLTTEALYISECARARSLLDSLLDPPIVEGELPFAGIGNGQVDGQAIAVAVDSSEELLQPSEAMLEYVIAGNCMYLSVITSASVFEPILVSSDVDQLTIAIVELRHEIEPQTGSADGELFLPDPTAVLAQFYETLLQPALTQLDETIDTLIFIPSGPLWYVPFAALVMTDQPEIEVEGVGLVPMYRPTYLIDQYALAYLPRMTDLETLASCTNDTGVSSFAGFAWSRSYGLYSYDERLVWMLDAFRVCALGELESSHEIHVGDDATKSAFLAGVEDVDLLAIICPRDDLSQLQWNSQLQFFPNKEEDGQLAAWELLALDLRETEMVILGAGPSNPFMGFYQIQRDAVPLASDVTRDGSELNVNLVLEVPFSGQDVLIFPQAFLAAGAGGVLQPIWDVSLSVLETLLLVMCDRHTEGMPWGEALREAQREMIASEYYDDVWFWAPYQLIGRWR